MKLEAVVFGVMRALMINCESTLPGLDSYRFRSIHRAHDQIMPWPGKVLLFSGVAASEA